MARTKGDTFKKTPDTLQKAILSMQRTLTKNKTDFINAPLTIEAEMGDGRVIERANPFVQEYRALIRDYASTMKAYKDITGQKGEKEQSSLEDIKSRFKIAK